VGSTTEEGADLQDPHRDTIGLTVNADHKHSRIKQYLKYGRALRMETVINDPGDLGCK
jgi:hypothetical protein